MIEYWSDGRFWRMCQKELRESLRDRRTIITLVMMPILVYPLLSMALQRLMIGSIRKTDPSQVYVIGTFSDADAATLQNLLQEAQAASDAGAFSPIEIQRLNPESTESNVPPISLNPPSAPQQSSGRHAKFGIAIADRISPREALYTGQVDLAVTLLQVDQIKTKLGESPSFAMEVEFQQGDSQSEAAMSELRRAMQLLNDFQYAFLRQQIDPKMAPALRLKGVGIGARSDTMASIAGVIPLVLILMTITGAVYPAIDLTAGERERGTMEAMIATPAPRFALLLSKYVAVVVVAILTALANLFAAWITLSFGGLGQAILGKQGFSFWMLLQILPILTIFAAFFSAILLALCSFARSFKEAQAYLIPVMLLSLGPGLVTLMPGIKFTALLGIVPLINILLLSRDIMTGQSSLVPAFAAVFSTIIYACAVLVVAARLFGAEAATSGSQETWGELLGRPKRKRATPELGELAIYLSILFPVFFIASNVGSLWGLKGESALVSNALLLIALFSAMPLFFGWYRRLDWQRTFLFTNGSKPGDSRGTLLKRWLGYVASVFLLGAGLWIVAFEAFLLLESWSLAAQLDKAEQEKLKADFLAVPFWLVFLTGALVPAIAEETFFRGFALSAFRSKLSAASSVLCTSVLFGIFHVIAGNVLSIEKFLPTIILGLALGWVAVRTGTIWPGMLLHALHNGLIFGMSRFSEQDLAKLFGSQTKHIPAMWQVGGLASIAMGIVCLLLATTGRKRIHENTI